MKKKFLILSGFLIMLLSLSSCGEKKLEAKNMEQIYKEKGIPVKVEKVTDKQVKRKYQYNAVLTGKKQSSAFAAIADKVEKIHVKVGDYVKKDQVLLTFPTDNPSAQYYQAKVAYENAKSTYERYKNLFETGGISKQQLDNVRTQFKVSEADWDAVKQMVKVKAPISGYVTNVAVRETENVDKKDMLFTISDLSVLKAKINIPESEIADIKVGSVAEANWNGKVIKGKVVQVDISMDPYTQSFRAVVEFENKGKAVNPGVTAEITVFGESNTNAISVERKNLVKEGDKYFVYLLNKNKAMKSEVKLGKASGLFVDILSGLKKGDMLITEGQLLLTDGAKVNVIKEEM